MIKDLCEEYFSTFERKDLDCLSGMFSDDISLRDWEINVQGKKNVLSANKNIFESVGDIKIKVLEIYESGMVCVCEIVIFVDSDEILVTDIIGFNSDGKIDSIRAYKG